MNTRGSSYKKSSVAGDILSKTNGDPRTDVTAVMPKVFALWEFESDPNYPFAWLGPSGRLTFKTVADPNCCRPQLLSSNYLKPFDVNWAKAVLETVALVIATKRLCSCAWLLRRYLTPTATFCLLVLRTIANNCRQFFA